MLEKLPCTIINVGWNTKQLIFDLAVLFIENLNLNIARSSSHTTLDVKCISVDPYFGFKKYKLQGLAVNL